ncbi:hypothetical protein [Candidatus Enterococcus leclercqii]|uniref:hypothetical protein n=1 Tax=Candidatus Enterococcus leclercqii TaxID=1857218 RepID=UPI00137B8899|nr:hypothetical protein [Enterococcus sp. CU9D]KAF1293452.1 hypothetical protein BAU14_01690 [Enterococcus sp. CU9D]
MNNKRLWLSTLVAALLLTVILGITPVKEVVYSDSWPRKIIGILLFAALLFFWWRGLRQSRSFQRDFQYYVKTYELTPEKLARLTGFTKYDFSYDGDELLFMNSTPENRKRLMTTLQTQFGPVPEK